MSHLNNVYAQITLLSKINDSVQIIPSLNIERPIIGGVATFDKEIQFYSVLISINILKMNQINS